MGRGRNPLQSSKEGECDEEDVGCVDGGRGAGIGWLQLRAWLQCLPQGGGAGLRRSQAVREAVRETVCEAREDLRQEVLRQGACQEGRPLRSLREDPLMRF